MNNFNDLAKLAGLSKKTSSSSHSPTPASNKLDFSLQKEIKKEIDMITEGKKFLLELSKHSNQKIKNNKRTTLSESACLSFDVSDKDFVRTLINDAKKNKKNQKIKEQIASKLQSIMEKYNVFNPNELLVKFGASVIHTKSGITVRW